MEPIISGMMTMLRRWVLTTSGFHGRGFLLGLAKTLDKSHGLASQATGVTPAGSAAEELHQLLRGHVKELIQIDTTVCVLAERPPLPLLHSIFSGGVVCHLV